MRKENEVLLKRVFQGVKLTKKEQAALAWLSSWETCTVISIVSAFKKIGGV